MQAELAQSIKSLSQKKKKKQQKKTEALKKEEERDTSRDSTASLMVEDSVVLSSPESDLPLPMEEVVPDSQEDLSVEAVLARKKEQEQPPQQREGKPFVEYVQM